jgi:4-hydroxymandelate oxidase
MTGEVSRLLAEFSARAAATLSPEVFGYFTSGSGDGVSAAEAQDAWDTYRLMPRVLRDVTHVDPSTTVLGAPLSAPIAIAPTSLQRAADPAGEIAMAEAAVAMGGLVVVSSNAGTPFAQIGATGARWWLQIYVTADRSASLPVIEAAVAAGASGLVLTVDTPMVASKPEAVEHLWAALDPSWVRANFPPGAEAEKALDLGPHDIDWLRQVSGLPVVTKGVLHPQDARRCVDAGAAAVWVSNHGGRQLDYALPTAHALRDVVEAVGGEAEVYVDGGIRQGRHVLVAQALGATATFLGRPPLLALAAGGQDGVLQLWDALVREYVEVRRLVGAPSAEELTPELVRRLT